MSEDWTTLLVTYDQLEAEMIKDLLESGDINVVIRSAKVSPYPVNVGKMGEVKILVKECNPLQYISTKKQRYNDFNSGA